MSSLSVGTKVASRRIEGKPIPGYSIINEVKAAQELVEGSQCAAEPRAKAVEATVQLPLSELDEAKKVHIGADLSKSEKSELLSFLCKNKAVFAWSTKDLQGVSRELAQHSLNIAKGSKPRKQKLRKMSDERAEAA